MNRIFWFRIAFLASLLAYIPLKFILDDFSDTLMTVAYFLSSFYFVFSNDEMPKANFEIPEIHYYQKSRQNTYGYIMLAYFIISALLYSVLTLNGISAGIVVIAVWFVFHLVIIAYLKVFTPERQMVGIISDYINSKFQEKGNKINIFYLREYIRYLLQKEEDKKTKLPDSHKFIGKKDKEEIKKLFEDYYVSLKELLISEEIKALNDE